MLPTNTIHEEDPTMDRLTSKKVRYGWRIFASIAIVAVLVGVWALNTAYYPAIAGDLAVKQLEDISASLQELDADGKWQLLETCEAMASEYDSDSKEAKFLRSCNESFGLTA